MQLACEGLVNQQHIRELWDYQH